MDQSRFTERGSCSEVKTMKNDSKKMILKFDEMLNPLRGLKLSSCILYLCLLAILISESAWASKSDSQQLDPTEFLVAYASSKPDYMDASFSLYDKLSSPVSPASRKQERVASAGIEQRKHPSDSVYDGVRNRDIEKASDDTSEDTIVPVELLQQQKTSVIAQQPDSSIERQIWKTRITSPKNKKDQPHRAELMKIIEQIRSVEFHEETEPEPLIIIESPGPEQKSPVIDPNDFWMQEQTGEQAQQDQNESQSGLGEPLKAESLPRESLTPETLQLLENLSKQPEQVANPLGLADILYGSKQLHYAGIFYQEALKRAEAESADKKYIDWILFQTGNCLAKEEPETALKMYRRMITECPDSSLAYVADAQERLISWYLINQQ
jgi:hypothetical protein